MTVLVFGATGALGSSIVSELTSEGSTVLRISRRAGEYSDVSLDNKNWIKEVTKLGPVSGVVWAQGVNSAGTVPDVDLQDLRDAFEANVVFIVETLSKLVDGDCLPFGARCVVLSSIWQEHARPNKLAYIASKAALSGLIPALAIDLASKGISLNGVLPGVIDTPMTRANLSEAQIQNVEQSTPTSKLAKPEDVSRAVAWLVSDKSNGINGQWITVDNGWAVYRNV